MNRLSYYLFYHKYSAFILAIAIVGAVILNDKLTKVLSPRITPLFHPPRLARPVLKSKKDLILPKARKCVFQEGFQGGVVRVGEKTGRVFGRVRLKRAFSIEFIIKPLKGQSAYAHIIGNHPGRGHDGFAVMQDGNNDGRYFFGYGNGKEWLPRVVFQMVPDKWHYLAIVVDNGAMEVFQDGYPVAKGLAGDDVSSGPTPLCVGNWHFGDRPFSGLIEEVQLSNKALTRQAIVLNWELVETHYPNDISAKE